MRINTEITTLFHTTISMVTKKASFIEENVAQRFAVLLGCPTLLLFVHCVRSSSLDLLACYMVTGCYEITMHK